MSIHGNRNVQAKRPATIPLTPFVMVPAVVPPTNPGAATLLPALRLTAMVAEGREEVPTVAEAGLVATRAAEGVDVPVAAGVQAVAVAAAVLRPVLLAGLEIAVEAEEVVAAEAVEVVAEEDRHRLVVVDAHTNGVQHKTKTTPERSRFVDAERFGT